MTDMNLHLVGDLLDGFVICPAHIVLVGGGGTCARQQPLHQRFVAGKRCSACDLGFVDSLCCFGLLGEQNHVGKVIDEVFALGLLVLAGIVLADILRRDRKVALMNFNAVHLGDQ